MRLEVKYIISGIVAYATYQKNAICPYVVGDIRETEWRYGYDFMKDLDSKSKKGSE